MNSFRKEFNNQISKIRFDWLWDPYESTCPWTLCGVTISIHGAIACAPRYHGSLQAITSWRPIMCVCLHSGRCSLYCFFCTGKVTISPSVCGMLTWYAMELLFVVRRQRSPLFFYRVVIGYHYDIWSSDLLVVQDQHNSTRSPIDTCDRWTSPKVLWSTSSILSL